MAAGRQLPDGASLESEGVRDEATLYILGRLLGGAKKRKKKTYTKPKKIKHKHKKIKLRVLKFYKVSCSPLCACHNRTQLEAWRTRSTRPHLVVVPLTESDMRLLCPRAGGRLWQGAAAAQGVPCAHLRPGHLHGHPLQPRLLVGCSDTHPAGMLGHTRCLIAGVALLLS